MSVHLIIDGYNLLGIRGPAGFGDEAREHLLRELAAYRHGKGHPITVVFDGWQQPIGAERHEHRAGVQVVYSKKGERADQVIQRLAAEYGRDCAVVSSDREVAGFAAARGALVIGAAEFAAKLRTGLEEDVRSRPSPDWKGSDEDGGPVSRPEKKGNPRKLPKAVRERNRRLRRF